MFWYNKTLVEFDLVQHQVSFSGSRDVRLSFASSNITGSRVALAAGSCQPMSVPFMRQGHTDGGACDYREVIRITTETTNEDT